MKNKKLFALMATVMMATTAMGAFGACGIGGGGGGLGGGTIIEDSQYDETKANLSVATFDGGVGRAWLEDAIARFEAKYATATHFQAGKTGVKISLDGDKNKYGGNKLAEVGSLTKDVYFTEAVDYYTFVNNGLVADISDVVKGSMSAYGESGTIEDKLDPTTKEFMTKKDGKYYMLPFYDGFYGLIYDVELFETEGFYFDQDGDFTKDKSALSKGPDGKAGTYDDGLPATYDQMIELCDEIVAKGFVPFMYSGNYTAYVNRAFYGYATDYEGYDAYSQNNTFTGTLKVAKTVTPKAGTMEADIEFEEVPLSEANGYDLQRQAGKYYALAMQEALFGSTKYLGGAYNGLDYTVAQGEFIKSKYTSKRYAMLAEGIWWENEANPTFVELENLKGVKKSDRRFALMPVPKVNEAAAGEQTLFSVNSSFGFINKNAENMELAKEFMKFLHTDVEMSKFTAKTSIPRSLKYEVSAADRATATPYGQSIIDLRKNAKVVYPFSAADIVTKNDANFQKDTWCGVADKGDGKGLNNAFNAFKDSKATALEFFNGLYIYQKGRWNSLVK
ncbi:MAG: hypothetical protein IKA57_02285 [Clostridia bacterium]|nr:hypothetical protein [Clostridia bacterium]